MPEARQLVQFYRNEADELIVHEIRPVDAEDYDFEHGISLVVESNPQDLASGLAQLLRLMTLAADKYAARNIRSLSIQIEELGGPALQGPAMVHQQLSGGRFARAPVNPPRTPSWRHKYQISVLRRTNDAPPPHVATIDFSRPSTVVELSARAVDFRRFMTSLNRMEGLRGLWDDFESRMPAILGPTYNPDAALYADVLAGGFFRALHALQIPDFHYQPTDGGSHEGVQVQRYVRRPM